MTKKEAMLEFLKQRESDPSDKYYPKVQQVLEMKLKDCDDDNGAAGEHYQVKCLMIYYENVGTVVHAVRPVQKEATCLVDVHEFTKFMKKENAIIWL